MRTTMIRFLLLLALLSVLTTLGCQTTGSTVVEATPAQMRSAGTPLGLEAAGTVYRVALASQINDLRHNEPVPQVKFADTASRSGRESNFRYEGFKVGEVDFFTAEEVNGKARVHSVVKLLDERERGCAIQSLLEYHEDGDTVVLDESFARPVFTLTPRVEFYVVRYELWEKQVGTRSASWTALYDFAKANCEKVDGTSLVEREYVILAFAMDRLAPDTVMTMVASRSRGGTDPDQSLMSASYADYLGWRVAIMGGTFAFDRAKKFYVNVMVTPGTEDGSEAETLRVAQFSNS
ncbi:hypothetical protein SAMN02745704_02396 [Paucidesulfovibrio gracilis DSM 16080]|uniref:Uncharacterized protein n=1 Tax=Paucidesulfovibrio gracilis DSM 16080 TaxID=1121449 RepID=A0A1T4XRL8_9BACT|nr:hypothetical protein [Paucidesulfovibrio gracilis]SKA92174.1 hypothetical protein SAMN02745704_02396 [Paucidesulfovibrio gracilis DSM 16080]